MQKTAQEILEHYALAAGLMTTWEEPPQVKSLAERLQSRPYLMAPMAGVSDAAWRIMACAGGAALAYSEMVSVAGIHFGGNKTWDLALPHEFEPELAVQLFGAQVEQFREASEQVVKRVGKKLVLIDINMACPVPKVTRKGEGSALMLDSGLASEIVAACREGIAAGAEYLGIEPVPVSCKIRRGYKMDNELAPKFAQKMQEAGVSAIAVHGRFANQFYRGEADWSTISRVVDAVDIPVIASGDIKDADSAKSVREQTGATAVMVARGTYGNPWIFNDAQLLQLGKTPPQHDLHQRLAAFCCHVALLEATGAHIARARSIAGWYFRGIPDAAEWRDQAMHCLDAQSFIAMAKKIEETLS